MGYIEGEERNQGTLFPVVLDDFVPADHMCRVIDAFVEKLVMSDLGSERAQAAETVWLCPARFIEALSVRLSEPDSLVAAFGS
jgi:transposase